jgi:hypothetical protein
LAFEKITEVRRLLSSSPYSSSLRQIIKTSFRETFPHTRKRNSLILRDPEESKGM